MSSAAAQARRALQRGRPAILYVVLDSGRVAPEQWPEEAAALFARGVEILQLRAKHLGARAFAELAREVMRRRGTGPTAVLVNDRVDVARVSGADGVHLGQEDLSPRAARELLGADALVGATAHDLAELAAVQELPIDYVGYGAVFPTRTRPGSSVCGPAALTAAVAASTLPVIAIGGLGPDNVDALAPTGVAGVAVASAVSPLRARPGAVEALRSALERW